MRALAAKPTALKTFIANVPYMPNPTPIKRPPASRKNTGREAAKQLRLIRREAAHAGGGNHIKTLISVRFRYDQGTVDRTNARVRAATAVTAADSRIRTRRRPRSVLS